MSEVTVHPRRSLQDGSAGKKRAGGTRRSNYTAIHRNLLPVEVHPLPTLIPHNPLSLIAIALSYFIQVLAPPQRPVYKGYFSSATSSIHITDEETQRALWKQGFFGRGNLSRSEPMWLENQKQAGRTAEENTDRRRKERRQFKIERAKVEQAEIEEELSKNATSNRTAPEIINSFTSTTSRVKTNEHDFDAIANVLQSARAVPPSSATSKEDTPPLLPPKLLDLEEHGATTPIHNGHVTSRLPAAEDPNNHIEGFDEWRKAVDTNGLPTPPPTSTSSEASLPEPLLRPTKRLQRQKTVRFSPTIEAREFDLSSPVVSPIKAPGISPTDTPIDEASSLDMINSSATSTTLVGRDQKITNQEHLQISLEEAFFLSYALGVLDIYPSSEECTAPLSTASLLSLFRRQSYYPARSLSVASEPSDPFMMSYAVYHHYRSMGWVVRSGVKFGVDYLLYNRGPAFSHAEFAVVVLPNHTDGSEKEKKDWWLLHGINRVQAQVHKSLVLCYVDVPAQLSRPDLDIGDIFSRYKIRDVNVKRWTPNRSRD